MYKIQQKQRDISIDYARGIAIIMVYVGHSILYYPPGLFAECVWSQYLRNMILSCNMPVFFMISGLLLGLSKKSNIEVAKAKIKKLLIISQEIFILQMLLYPNQYINYTPDTPAIIRAQEICEGITDPIEKARAIYRAIFLDDTIEYEITNSEGNTEIVYGEEIKFTYRQLDPSPLPNINKAFATNAGVCKDQAGLYTAMLRSVGVPAIYAVGDGEPSHAWTVLIINGKRYQMDLILHLHFDLIPDDMTYTRTY